jgi:UDP-N-acetylmuramate--alanine ligase
MLNLDNIQRIYFIGIGGIGMSALARYFVQHGKAISGYDKTPTALTHELHNEGIQITYEDSLETLDKSAELVIFTPAIPKDHKQYNYFLQSGIPVVKRAQVLGWITNQKYSICIAGSHGKTSTSSITAHLLKTANKDVGAFLGGISLNFGSNFIDGNTYAIAEADEYDRSFLNLEPNIALITSVDTDHLDIYGNLEAIENSFREFTGKIRPDGVLISHISVPEKVQNPAVKNFRYALDNEQADFYTRNLEVHDGAYHADVVHPGGVVSHIVSYYGGRHNMENAVGAIAIAKQLGISDDDIRIGVASFKGVKRRFETHLRTNKVVYIDDYAHHPRELDAAISAAKELYPGKKVTAIFQPHLYTRTRDLCEEFAAALSQLDTVILLDIYPAREWPIPGVTSQLIFDQISIPDKISCAKDDLINELSRRTNWEVVLSVGAGDIDTKVNEIKLYLESIAI